MASAKLDGVRVLIKNGVVLSRTLKPIPNKFVQKVLGSMKNLDGLDGEIIVGSPTDLNVMQTTTSGVMSRDGEPDFKFFVFDFYSSPEVPFEKRYEMLEANKRYFENQWVGLLPHILIKDQDALDYYESKVLENGYEGVMIRKPSGKYKYGRSTEREGFLLKLKRFSDSEAIVIGVEELLRNANEAVLDELGYTKRSSCIENKIPANTLGALVCKDLTTHVVFNIGSGFTDKQRADLWLSFHNGSLVGNVIKYKYFANGIKEAPRFPVFLGFRSKIDM